MASQAEMEAELANLAKTQAEMDNIRAEESANGEQLVIPEAHKQPLLVNVSARGYPIIKLFCSKG